jgi:hypothetical protein
MTRKAGCDHLIPVLVLLALALVAGAGSLSAAHAQSAETPQQFWHIPVWARPGAWQDDTALYPKKCVGSLEPRSDSLVLKSHTVTVRFLRNRRVEARPDFGGYRIYRYTNTRGTTTGMLLRRYSVNRGDEPLWHFSRVDTADAASLPFKCDGAVVHDSVLTFVDPDSSGALGKVCRKLDEQGRCISRGDSVWALMTVPGPHDGFRLWYTVTYEAYNTTDNTYEDLFVPDTGDDYARCGEHGVAATCPNLNDRFANMIADSIEATAGPAKNLQAVTVVPNPFRGRESWDLPDGNEVQFINLPAHSRIRIYTVAGDLVRDLDHNDPVRDFERWDLKNANGRDAVSGIYMYRVESGTFFAQGRFIVVR